MDNIELVNLALAGDKAGFETAFNNAISGKVTDALEIKKVEIASNLLGDEETHEVTDATIEVGGTDGNDAVESSPATEDAASAE